MFRLSRDEIFVEGAGVGDIFIAVDVPVFEETICRLRMIEAGIVIRGQKVIPVLNEDFFGHINISFRGGP